jgi:hypothetical protein
MSAACVHGGRWAQLAAWWARATLAVAHELTGLMAFGTTREAGVAAACAAWGFRRVRRLLQRLACWGRDEPRTAEDLLALARSVEHVSPSFAAELRFFAMNQPDAAQ